jgi:hypothetical protein
MTDGIVADLQLETSLQGLTVRNVRFGLDPDPPSIRRRPRYFRVPSPQVALDRERHLGPPPQRGVQSGPESLEQGQLSAISDRIAGGVSTKAEVQPNDRAVARHEFQRWVANDAALEPTHLRVRDADRSGHGSLAEARRGPSLSPVELHSMNGLMTSSPAPVRSSLACRHVGRMVTFRPSLAVVAADLERPAFIPAVGALRIVDSGRLTRQMERPAFQSATEGPLAAESVCPARRLERPVFQGPRRTGWSAGT